MQLYSPLYSCEFNARSVVDPSSVGAFGVRRKFEHHSGVDLYCPPEALVSSIERGTVISIGPFTGQKTNSPWWNDTDYIMVEGSSGVVLYGEVKIYSGLKVGAKVLPGQIIGEVVRVLKKDNVKSRIIPSNHMLHFELYEPGTTVPCQSWVLDTECPKGLLDPTPLLRTIINIKESNK